MKTIVALDAYTPSVRSNRRTFAPSSFLGRDRRDWIFDPLSPEPAR